MSDTPDLGQDLMAQMDEARNQANEANGRTTAVPIAAFHKALIDGGVDAITAGNIAFMYATKILNVPKRS